MNKNDESRLADLARRAQALRTSIDGAESMLRSWARHRAEAGEIFIMLSDRRKTGWYPSVHLPAEVVQAELMPVLKRIRDEAAKQLRDLAPDINPRDVVTPQEQRAAESPDD